MKKRWLAFVLTIVMLSSNLTPVWDAIARGEEITAVTASTPVFSDASMEASAQTADASSGEAVSPVAEPAAISAPVVTAAPTEASSAAPAPVITEAPTTAPTAEPTPVVTEASTAVPTAVPTPVITEAPASEPAPTSEENETPTATEIPAVTEAPAAPEATEVPVSEPTATPEVAEAPTAEPTATAEVTEAPAAEPTATPEATEAPTVEPTTTPEATEAPTAEPTATPEATEAPTAEPTVTPETTVTPTAEPTVEPSASPEVTLTPAPTPVPDPLVVSISMSPSYLALGGGNISASASISGGTGDYSVALRIYSPYSLDAEKIVTLTAPGNVSLNSTPVYGGTHTAEVTVTDASGQTAQASATMAVSEGFPESPSVWEESVSSIALTGDWATDILAVARSQIGNREYENCFIVDGSGKLHYYTRYGHWFGAPYQDWCAMFVAFCLHYAEIDTKDYPVDAGCTTWMEKLQAIGAYARVENGEDAEQHENAYLPVSGDLVFINHEGEPTPQHVGLVEYVENGVLHTIEGNANDSVMRREYELTDETIVGYGNTGLLAERAKEKEAAQPDDPDQPEAVSEQIPMAEGTIGYTTLKKVNMRSHTDTKSKLLRTIVEPGTAVSVLFAVDVVNTRWYFVEYDGTNGYIRGDLLSIEEPAAPEATPEAAEDTTPEATETVAPETTPEVTEAVDPEVTPEAAEDAIPEATETVAPETTPENTEAVDPEVTPEATEDVIPEVTDEVTPEATPEVTEDAAPEVTVDPSPAPNYFCGTEEHTHAETCYVEDGTLVCELPEHSHTEDCLVAPEVTVKPTPAPNYFCGTEEHTHAETCYAEDGTLVCELPEHTHTEDCLVAPEATVEPTPAPAYFCGAEEHTHAETCYAEDGTLVCELPEHAHTEDCLAAPETAPVYFCGTEEHIHAETCYAEDGTLVCELPEHAHTEDCLVAPETAPTYFCGIEEHAHAETCYAEDGALVCELPEHAHTEDCLVAPEVTVEPTPAPNYFCGNEEHIHAETCYAEDGALVCELPEHAHTEDCLLTPPIVLQLTLDQTSVFAGEQPVTLQAQVEGGVAPYAVEFSYTSTSALSTQLNGLSLQLYTRTQPAEPETESTQLAESGVADFEYQPETAGTHTLAITVTDAAGTQAQAVTSLSVAQRGYHETEADFLDSISAATLTGDVRADIAAIASTQLGYAESTTDYIVEDGTVRGYTRYGAWAQQPYMDWNVPFALFALHYAGVDYTPTASPSALADELRALSQYHEADAYVPLQGDLVFFDWEEDGVIDHVGIIADAVGDQDAYTITTIEGDVDDMVITRTFVVQSTPSIAGYGQVADNLPMEHVAHVIAMIDAMPSADAIDAKLLEYEEAEDYEGMEAWYTEAVTQVVQTYHAYSELPTAYQRVVTNADKLLELEYIWSVMTLQTIATDTVTVHKVNQYNWDSNISLIVYGDSVGNVFPNYGIFGWWNTYVIEEDANGYLYVKEIRGVGDNESKSDCVATTTDGFVLLMHSPLKADVQVGTFVYPAFDYKTAAANSDGLGKLYFYKWNYDTTAKTVPSADTDELIEVNLYDYDYTINNNYSAGGKYPGFQQDGGTKSIGTELKRFSLNFGNNITADIASVIGDVTTNDPGAINTTANGANSPISGAMSLTMGTDGYPALADGTSLAYMFTGKENSKSINGLFQHNAQTGAYSYNSRENHAQFDGDSTFTLYDAWISSNYIMYPFGNFLPFNNINMQTTHATDISREYFLCIADRARVKYEATSSDVYQTLNTVLLKFVELMDAEYPDGWDGGTAMQKYFTLNGLTYDGSMLHKVYSIDYDEATDFFFGMDMEMDLMQPKGGMTGTNNAYPMEFYFTGDDDVWVYLDDVLFLDLSGIHRHVGGKIDFVNGKIYYYSLDITTGDVSTTADKVVTFAEAFANAGVSTDSLNEKGTFKDYSHHKFNFYYTERGAGSGVCRMNFNFPLLRKNSISVGKELSVDDESKLSLLGSPDFKFQVLNENGTALFIDAGTEYTIYDASNQEVGTGTTDANGVFTLKAGQRAEFTGIAENSGKYFVRELLDYSTFEQYGTISVGGSTITNSYDVVIDNDKFKGVDSPIKDASDGTTLFNFNNQLVFNKLGKLEIAKELAVYPRTRTTPEFAFEVTLDGAKLPVGTQYTVGSETKTVETEGIVIVPAGSSAVISGIIVGTAYTVKETEASSLGYKVSYRIDDEDYESGTSASGTIVLESTVTVSFLNAEDGVTAAIPIQKVLLNPDEQQRVFTFKLEQVTGQSGTELAENGTTLTAEITVPSDDQTAVFNLHYPATELTGLTLPHTFYYRISEVAGTEAGVQYDTAVHIVAVTVSRDESGTLTAVLSPTLDQPLTFTNTILRNLTLSKTVNGADPGKAFQFDVTITDAADQPISGTYSTGDATSITLDAAGKATVPLKHGQSLTIYGLPYGAKWTIVETSADGYYVSWRVGQSGEILGTTVQGTLAGTDAAITVTCTNTPGQILPETGGAGTLPYTVGGLLTIAIATLLLYSQAKRRREGSTA